MNLETLMKGLTEPRILSDGTIRTPNYFMLWAAGVIKDLLAVKEDSNKLVFAYQSRSESDRTDLVKYIDNYNQLMLTVYELKKQLAPIDLTEYREAMNKDRE